MLGKQYVIDLLVVILIPVLIIGAYFLFWRADSSTLVVTSGSPIPGQDEPGAKTKIALETLRSIKFNDSLFSDPSLTELKVYTFDIPSVSLYRQYPFTPSQAVLDKIKSSRNFPPDTKK